MLIIDVRSDKTITEPCFVLLMFMDFIVCINILI